MPLALKNIHDYQPVILYISDRLLGYKMLPTAPFRRDKICVERRRKSRERVCALTRPGRQATLSSFFITTALARGEPWLGLLHPNRIPMITLSPIAGQRKITPAHVQCPDYRSLTCLIYTSVTSATPSWLIVTAFIAPASIAGQRKVSSPAP